MSTWGDAQRIAEAIYEARRVRDEEHQYLSTACHHANHDRCRLTCKFCAKPCLCACHNRSAVMAEVTP